MNLKVTISCFLTLLGLCCGMRRPLLSRPLPVYESHNPPCYGGSAETFDVVEEDRSAKTLLLAGAVGYYLGNKQKNPPVTINNNIYGGTQGGGYPPCSGISGSWASAGSGGGLIGGILGQHPILSNVLQNGWLGGGGNGIANGVTYNRGSSFNVNRSIRQFRRFIRPITRVFR